MHSPSSSSVTALDAYLSALDDALARLDDDERREILMETRSHVAERTARFPFPSIDDVLQQLGAPRVYARQFLREDTPPRTRDGRSALRGLARLAAGGWLALPVLLVVVFGYAIALTAFAVGLAKVLTPDDVGVWFHQVGGEERLFHAGFNAELGGHEVLGYKLAVIAFAIAFVVWFALSAFLRWLARSDAPSDNGSEDESRA